MSAEISRVLGKKQEDNLVELWKDVQGGIKTYADRHRIDLVLGFGDPMEKALLDQFANVNRKMVATELGSTVTYYHSPTSDIAAGVVRLLNDPDEAVRNVKAEMPAVRVGVVNVPQVFNRYDRADKFKRDMGVELASYKKKGARLAQDDLKVELAQLNAEMERILGKKQEEILTTLWRDVHMGTAAHAKDQRIDIVLGFGDPMEKDRLHQFANVKRKLKALDDGSVVPLFATPKVDLSLMVTQTLNNWMRPGWIQKGEGSSKSPRND